MTDVAGIAWPGFWGSILGGCVTRYCYGHGATGKSVHVSSGVCDAGSLCMKQSELEILTIVADRW